MDEKKTDARKKIAALADALDALLKQVWRAKGGHQGAEAERRVRLRFKGMRLSPRKRAQLVRSEEHAICREEMSRAAEFAATAALIILSNGNGLRAIGVAPKALTRSCRDLLQEGIVYDSDLWKLSPSAPLPARIRVERSLGALRLLCPQTQRPTSEELDRLVAGREKGDQISDENVALLYEAARQLAETQSEFKESEILERARMRHPSIGRSTVGRWLALAERQRVLTCDRPRKAGSNSEKHGHGYLYKFCRGEP